MHRSVCHSPVMCERWLAEFMVRICVFKSWGEWYDLLSDLAIITLKLFELCFICLHRDSLWPNKLVWNVFFNWWTVDNNKEDLFHVTQQNRPMAFLPSLSCSVFIWPCTGPAGMSVNLYQSQLDCSSPVLSICPPSGSQWSAGPLFKVRQKGLILESEDWVVITVLPYFLHNRAQQIVRGTINEWSVFKHIIKGTSNAKGH